jgi:GH18 family chitinase
LRKAFKEEYKSTYRKYILTAFVPSDEARIDAGYQVKLVCRYLDYVSVATYDYTGPYDTKTGYNSPLYSRTHIQNSVVIKSFYCSMREENSLKMNVFDI